MDPVLSSLVVNLLSQGIWEVGSRSVASVEDLTQSPPLERALHEAAAKVAEGLSASEISNVAPVFEAPETRAIVRALYLQRITDPGATPTQARAAFAEVCERVALTAKDATPDKLYSALIEGCELVLDAAMDNGVLSALDAKAVVRHKLLAEQLDAIQRRLDQPRVTTAEIDGYEKALVTEVMARTAHVEPPDFYGAPRVQIDRLYVAPEIALARHDGERVPLTYDEWRGTIRHSVVLGNPGAGKSTLATKLCHDIASRYEACLLGGRRLVPFIVTLREYGAVKK